MEKVRVVGVDLGAQKTILVSEDGEIIRTDTGSVARPSLVCFSNGKRLFGDEALMQISSETTLSFLFAMLGKSLAEIRALPWSQFIRLPLEEDEKGRVCVRLSERQHGLEIPSLSGDLLFPLPALAAMYLADLHRQLSSGLAPGETLHYVFTRPLRSAQETEAFRAALAIADILPAHRVSVSGPAASLAAVYLRKTSGLAGAGEGRNVLLVDVGMCVGTAVLLRTPPAQNNNNNNNVTEPEILGQGTSELVGSVLLDCALFQSLAPLKKLLSTLQDARLVVESVRCAADGSPQDAELAVSREQLALAAAGYAEQLRAWLRGVVGEHGVDCVEVSGGGCRAPLVQQALQSLLTHHTPNNNTSSGHGHAHQAAVLNLKNTAASPAAAALGLDVAAIRRCVDAHFDALARIMDDYYDGEGLAPDGSGYVYAPQQQVEVEVEAEEQAEEAAAGLAAGDLARAAELLSPRLHTRLSSLLALARDVRRDDRRLLAAHYADLKLRRQRQDAELEEIQRHGEEDDAENAGDYDADNDAAVNRKLKKADRVRLLAKNKDEGAELFKAGNFKLGVIRYQKALNHLQHLLDSGAVAAAEEKAEFQALQVTLLSNIALCYSKLGNHENSLGAMEKALAIDPAHKKTLYRRGVYFETVKKDFDRALQDFKKALGNGNSGSGSGSAATEEDKVLAKAVERCRKEIDRQTAQEKKIWAKAFA
eukprot:gene29297-35369_t